MTDSPSTPATEQAAGQKPTRQRFVILSLVAVATMINYLDRTLISVAAPAMSEELQLGPVAMGLVFSVFSWSYAAAQIPGGALLDRFGTRKVYFAALTLWSALTAMQGVLTSFWLLIAVRLGVGAAEAPCFPANSRILVSWFPQRERARANSVYSVGMYFGIAFLSPVLFWILSEFGWRSLFIGVGLIGVLFGLVWLKGYREPAEHSRINDAERQLIASGGGNIQANEPGKFEWSVLFALFRRRQIIGASIGQFATNSTLVFFLTWFPTYLAVERGMDWLKIGFMATLPFLAASVGVLVGGQLSDWLVRRTGSLTFGRKFPIVAGLLMSSSIASAAFLDSDTLIIAVLSLAFFGQGMSNLGWTLISEVAPLKYIGLTGGAFNLCTNLAGIITPLAIGWILAVTASFYWALAMIGVVALIGAFSYVFIVGEVKRLEI
jgi:ACS family D-galactonate transporter-like MFS transporter